MANPEFLLKCLPTGSLPYEDNTLAIKMMLKLFEHSPYLAMLPNVSAQDNIVDVTLGHMPGVGLKEKRYLDMLWFLLGLGVLLMILEKIIK